MATLRTDKMERLAYDVFKHTMLIFNTTTAIPPPECTENNYGENTDFIFVLSRGYISYQLMKRDIWKLKFEARFKSNGLKKWEQIEEILEELLKEIDIKQKKPGARIVSSLALINELIQFLYSKNRRLFLNKLPILWRKYFASFEGDFEKEGGLSHLYSVHAKSFPVLDKLIDYVFSTSCLKYGYSEVSIPFIGICKDSSSKVKIKKDIDRTVAHGMSLSSSFDEKLSIDSRSLGRSGMKSEASGSLENPGLGIIPHEKRSDFFSLSAEKTIEETSATASTEVKLYRKQCGQKSLKQAKVPRQSCTPIGSPEGWSKDQSSLTGSPLSPEGRLKGRGSPAGSPLSPEGRSKYRGTPTRSPLSPEGRSKYRGSFTGSLLSSKGPLEILSTLTGSPLSPEERLKGRGSPTVSPLSREGRLKDRGSPAGSPLSPEGRLKDGGSFTGSLLSPKRPLEILSSLTRSPLSPEGRSKDQSPAGSPLSPEGRLMGREALAGLPSSPQEQTHRRGLPRSPVGISRLEQKRQKYRQSKKPDPKN